MIVQLLLFDHRHELASFSYSAQTIVGFLNKVVDFDFFDISRSVHYLLIVYRCAKERAVVAHSLLLDAH